MGRRFAPFEVVVHFTGMKSNQEFQQSIDDFYINTVEYVLSESVLTEPQQLELLDRLAGYHKTHTKSQDV